LAPRYIPTGLALSEKGFACHAKASALWRPSSPAGIANGRWKTWPRNIIRKHSKAMDMKNGAAS
jgi:hypothetical protein